jgi:hypothetical protein
MECIMSSIVVEESMPQVTPRMPNLHFGLIALLVLGLSYAIIGVANPGIIMGANFIDETMPHTVTLIGP